MDPKEAEEKLRSFVYVGEDGQSFDPTRRLWTSGDSNQGPTLPQGMTQDMYEMALWQTPGETAPPASAGSASFVTIPSTRDDSGNDGRPDSRRGTRHGDREDSRHYGRQDNRGDSRYDSRQDRRGDSGHYVRQDRRGDSGHYGRQDSRGGGRYDSRQDRKGDSGHYGRQDSRGDGRYDSRQDRRGDSGDYGRQNSRGDSRHYNRQDSWGDGRSYGSRPDSRGDSRYDSIRGQRADRRRDEAPRSMEGGGDSLSQQRRSDASQGRRSMESDEMRSVLVRGVSESTTRDELYDYMESYRRSGGGPVDGFDLDRRRREALVTYRRSEDAVSVADPNKRHELGGSRLTVSLHRPAPPLLHCLRVNSLPDHVTTDNLRLFVERHTPCQVDKILYGFVEEEDESVVIFFREDIDVSAAQTALVGKFISDGVTLNITTLPSTGVLLVRGMPEGVVADTLENYFDNERRGNAGEVRQVEMHHDYALVTLQNAQVASRVVKQRHTIDRCNLDVSLYLDCLGPSGGSIKRQLRIPAPVRLTDQDQLKVAALLRVQVLQHQLESLLNDCHATLARGTLSCTVTETTQDARRVLRSWEQDLRQALDGYLRTISVTNVASNREEFTAAAPQLRQMATSAQGGIEFFFDEENHQTVIVYCEKHREQARDMENVIQTVKQKLEREKQVRKETITAPGGELELLKNTGVDNTIKERFPEMDISLDIGGCKVILRGTEQELREATHLIMEILSTVTCQKLPYGQLPYKEAVHLLQSAEAVEIVKRACLKENPSGAVRFKDECLFVYAFDSHQAEQMLRAGQNMIQREEIELGEHHREVMNTESVTKALRALERHGKTTIIDRSQPSTLVLVSVHPDFLRDVRNLVTAVEENGPTSKMFHLDPLHLSLLQQYLNTGNLQGGLRQDRTKFDRAKSAIITTGTKNIHEEVGELVAKFTGQVVTDTLEFTEPSFANFIESQEGQHYLKQIGIDKKCVIKVTNLAVDGAQGRPKLEMGWDNLGTGDGQQPASRHFNVPQQTWADPMAPTEESSIPRKPNLYVRDMWDITKEEHDVLVNSNNGHLDLRYGQVSKDMLRVGGQKLQDDCRAKYPRGIRLGDIAVTGPGRTITDAERDGKDRLQCNKVYHCCLPETTDRATMKRVVKEAMTKCLAQADQDKMRSIGFPALGAGTLKYPIDLVTETMYDAALEYGRNNPGTSVADVFFIVHKKDKENREPFKAKDRWYKALVNKRDQVPKAANCMPALETEEGVKRWQFFQATRGRVLLTVSALHRKDVQDAHEELLIAYTEQLELRKVPVERLACWDQFYIQQVVMDCKAHDVDVIFNFSLSWLELEGLRKNVTRIQLSTTIPDANGEVARREHAFLTRMLVQWCWVDDSTPEGSFRPYDYMNNYRIESAYKSGNDVATVFDLNKVPYRVNFILMKEIPERLTDNEADECALDVVRRDIKTERTYDAPVPEEWTQNSSQEVVKLATSSREYIQVSEKFRQSLGRQVSIIEIDRIQNVTLYKQYMTLKRDFRTRHQGDNFEKTPLWHGTKEDTVASITRHGFNRSYCMRHVYGQGVYFAKSAENACEDKYAGANANGERRVFYCQVLVGDYTAGNQNLRFVPKKPNNANAYYDSAVDNVEDPSIFVVFKDMQAYPQYLIVFKNN